MNPKQFTIDGVAYSERPSASQRASVFKCPIPVRSSAFSTPLRASSASVMGPPTNRSLPVASAEEVLASIEAALVRETASRTANRRADAVHATANTLFAEGLRLHFEHVLRSPAHAIPVLPPCAELHHLASIDWRPGLDKCVNSETRKCEGMLLCAMHNIPIVSSRRFDMRCLDTRGEMRCLLCIRRDIKAQMALMRLTNVYCSPEKLFPFRSMSFDSGEIDRYRKQMWTFTPHEVTLGFAHCALIHDSELYSRLATGWAQ